MWCSILGLLVASALIVPVLLLSRPVALIKVVDESGNPIGSAEVKPVGLRPKSGAGTFSWNPASHGPNDAVKTDVAGIARIRYPQYVLEKLQTGEISFSVDHPEYCRDHSIRKLGPGFSEALTLKDKFDYLLALVKGEPNITPIALRRGATVVVAGYIGSPTNRVALRRVEFGGFFPPARESWASLDGGAMMCRRVTPGTNTIRLAHLAQSGQIFFSDIVKFTAVGAHRYRFDLDLKPALHVTGKLDDSVPRPVRNGTVHLNISNTRTFLDPGPLFWRTWTEVQSDGTFRVAGVPPGNLEMIAICDGYVSRPGTNNIVRTPNHVPQMFSMRNPETAVILRMEPAGACELLVTDQSGAPVEGAKVGFSPNVMWGGRASTIFAMQSRKAEDLLRDGPAPTDSKFQKPTRFSAVTGKTGIAIVSNLPPQTQSFYFDHERFEMPLQGTASLRRASIALRSGEVTLFSLSVQPKGTQVAGE